MLSLHSIINELKKIPPEEYYRFIVNGAKHQSERGWLEYALREPNCLPATFQALQFAFTNLEDLTITPDLIKNIHKKVATNVKNIKVKPGHYRRADVGFEIGKLENDHYFNKEGFETFYDWIKQNVETLNTDLVAERNGFFTTFISLKTAEQTKEEMWAKMEKGVRFHYQGPAAEHLEGLIQKTCDDYNRLIKETDDPDEKLRIIAEHVQRIERIHPFYDANGRTSLILLQRLLVQNGFLPVMLLDPNDIDGFGINSLVGEIKKGINNTKEVISGKKKLFDYETEIIKFKEREDNPLYYSDAEKEHNQVVAGFYQAQDQMEQFIGRLPLSINEEDSAITVNEQMETLNNIINNRLIASRLEKLVERFGEKKEIAPILDYLSTEGYQCYKESLNDPWELIINWASQKEENFSFLKQSIQEFTKNQPRDSMGKIPLIAILLDSLNQKGLKEEMLSPKSDWLSNSTLFYSIAATYPVTERFAFIKKHINFLQKSELLTLIEVLNILPKGQQEEILLDVGIEYIKSLIKSSDNLLFIMGKLLPDSLGLLIQELAKDEAFIKNTFVAEQISFISDYLAEEQRHFYRQYYSTQTPGKQTKQSVGYVILSKVDEALAKDEANRIKWQGHYDKYWPNEETDSWLENTKSLLQDYLSLYQDKTNDVSLANKLLEELTKINLKPNDKKEEHFETLRMVEALIESYQEEAKKLSIESKVVVVDKLSSRLDYISNKLTSMEDDLSAELYKPLGM